MGLGETKPRPQEVSDQASDNDDDDGADVIIS